MSSSVVAVFDMDHALLRTLVLHAKQHGYEHGCQNLDLTVLLHLRHQRDLFSPPFEITRLTLPL